MLTNISTNPKENLTRICAKHHHEKAYFKYNHVSQYLSKSRKTTIFKCEEIQRVVKFDCSKYMENFLSILSTAQLAEINLNPTVFTERKVQRTSKSIKKNCWVKVLEGSRDC